MHSSKVILWKVLVEAQRVSLKTLHLTLHNVPTRTSGVTHLQDCNAQETVQVLEDLSVPRRGVEAGITAVRPCLPSPPPPLAPARSLLSRTTSGDDEPPIPFPVSPRAAFIASMTSAEVMVGGEKDSADSTGAVTPAAVPARNCKLIDDDDLRQDWHFISSYSLSQQGAFLSNAKVRDEGKNQQACVNIAERDKRSCLAGQSFATPHKDAQVQSINQGKCNRKRDLRQRLRA
jgi:hypothetical protein